MEKNEEQKTIEDSIEYTKLEAKAIESFLTDIYSKKVPEPKAPSRGELSFWNIAGLEASLFTIAGIGIAIYSAIRTGGLFFIMETLLLRQFNLPQAFSNIVSLGAMITSLAAFELFVLADGFAKGRASTSMNRSNLGLYSSLIVIVLAGIFTGLGLIETLGQSLQTAFYTIIALVTAVAGGFVVLYAGENIGYTLTKVEKIKAKRTGSHQNAYKKWRDSGVTAYYESHYALGSKKSLKFSRKLKQKDTGDKDKKEKLGEIVDQYLGKFETEYTKFLASSIENFVNKHGRTPEVEELTQLGITEKYAKMALDKYLKPQGKISIRPF